MVGFLGWFLSAGWTSSSFYKEKLLLKIRSDKVSVFQTTHKKMLSVIWKITEFEG